MATDDDSTQSLADDGAVELPGFIPTSVPDAPSWSDIAPKWLQNNEGFFKRLQQNADLFRTLQNHAAVLKNFVTGPKAYIRGVIYGDLLRGFARLVAPIFSALTILFLGTNPTAFAGQYEQFGIADLPAFVLGYVAGLVGILIRGYFSAIETVYLAITPDVVSPLSGLVTTVVTVGLIYVVLETIWRLILARVMPGLSGLIGGG